MTDFRKFAGDLREFAPVFRDFADEDCYEAEILVPPRPPYKDQPLSGFSKLPARGVACGVDEDGIWRCTVFAVCPNCSQHILAGDSWDHQIYLGTGMCGRCFEAYSMPAWKKLLGNPALWWFIIGLFVGFYICAWVFASGSGLPSNPVRRPQMRRTHSRLYWTGAGRAVPRGAVPAAD